MSLVSPQLSAAESVPHTSFQPVHMAPGATLDAPSNPQDGKDWTFTALGHSESVTSCRQMPQLRPARESKGSRVRQAERGRGCTVLGESATEGSEKRPPSAAAHVPVGSGRDVGRRQRTGIAGLASRRTRRRWRRRRWRQRGRTGQRRRRRRQQRRRWRRRRPIHASQLDVNAVLAGAIH